MSDMSTKKRNSLPDSSFAGPGRSYPVNDKAHARNAKARASEEEHKGKLSSGEKAKIDAKADKVLGEATPTTVVDSILENEPALAVEAFQGMVKDRARLMVLSMLEAKDEDSKKDKKDKDDDCDCDDDDKDDKKKSKSKKDKDDDEDDDDKDDKKDKKDFFKKKD